MRFITSFPHQQAAQKQRRRMAFLQGAIGRSAGGLNCLADKTLLSKGKLGST